MNKHETTESAFVTFQRDISQMDQNAHALRTKRQAQHTSHARRLSAQHSGRVMNLLRLADTGKSDIRV